MTLLLQYTLIFAAVLMLVALGGCFSEHSGVINLGLEGIMVIGALGGALVMRYLPSGTSAVVTILLTLLGSVALGVLFSTLLAVACINFKADQTIVGTAMNMLSVAAATVIVKALNTAVNPDDVSATIQYIEPRKAFSFQIGAFEGNWFMVIAVIALIVAYVTLYKTRFGLRLMACGEHPQAADSVGINVYKMRWAGVLISGVLGGLGGICYILAGRHDLRPVEAGTHRARGAAVRPVPRAVERVLRLRLPHVAGHPRVGVQYAAVHHLPARARLHVQELPRPQGRGHPVRQRQSLSTRASFRTPVKQDGGAFLCGVHKAGAWNLAQMQKSAKFAKLVDILCTRTYTEPN